MNLFLFATLCVLTANAATYNDEEDAEIGVLRKRQATIPLPVTNDVRNERMLEMIKKWHNVPGAKRQQNTCRPEYAELKQHTMCVVKPSSDTVKCGVSEADKKFIVDLHNELRSGVNPPATQMMKLEWSDEAAEVAQLFAETCPVNGHDKNRDVLGVYTGQNLAFNPYTWKRAIMAWYDEVKDYTYGVGSKNGKAVGHYTQIVHGTTNRVGCGFCSCKNTPWKYYYVCNYISGQYGYAKPYQSGRACAKCPGNCVNNLCDCKGKVCQNGGTLDPSTCKCTCLNPFIGDSCETKDCPIADDVSCWSAQPYGFGKSNCDEFRNVPPLCPNMCGVCPNKCPGKKTDSCKNGAVLNADTCKCDCTAGFSGDACDKSDSCAPDPWFCGDPWPPSYCTKYSNVPKDCPDMCGRCA